MYTLYGFPRSRTLRVVWLLEELGVGYDYINTYPHTETALRVNPTGKLPALVVNDDVIIDSSAICMYLADQHPELGLSYPSGTLERGQLDSWVHFAMADLELPLWTAAKHTFIIPEKHRVPDILVQCQREWRLGIMAMEQRLGDKMYVMGEQFTVADVLIGQVLLWANNTGFKYESETIQSYFERIKQRPALAKALTKEKEKAE